jgi:hypothetical protein
MKTLVRNPVRTPPTAPPTAGPTGLPTLARTLARILPLAHALARTLTPALSVALVLPGCEGGGSEHRLEVDFRDAGGGVETLRVDWLLFRVEPLPGGGALISLAPDPERVDPAALRSTASIEWRMPPGEGSVDALLGKEVDFRDPARFGAALFRTGTGENVVSLEPAPRLRIRFDAREGDAVTGTLEGEGFHLLAAEGGDRGIVSLAGRFRARIAGGEADPGSGAPEGAGGAGMTLAPLPALEDVLPGLGVTGPEAPPPLVPAGDLAEVQFLSALTAACLPSPAPPVEAARESGEEPGGAGSTAAGVPRAAFAGRTTVNTLSSPEPFEGAVLRMVLDECDGDIVPIPFLVGEDASRSWVLEFEEEGLRLAHDHREADGTTGEANLYGGFAHVAAPGAEDPRGETILYFPADARTLEARPAREVNVWAMALSADRRHFFYRLYLSGALRLEAAFDLGRAVVAPPRADRD